MQQRFLGRYKSILFGTWLAALQLLTALTASAWTLQPETLHYTVDASIFKDAAQVTVSLRQVDHEKFEGEVSVATNGLIAFCTAHRQDRYHTTMRLVQGRLQPLIYLEESRWGGKQLGIWNIASIMTGNAWNSGEEARTAFWPGSGRRN